MSQHSCGFVYPQKEFLMISNQIVRRLAISSFFIVLLAGFHAAGLTTVQYPENHKDICYQTQACYSVPVGSSDISPDRLKPYSAKWIRSEKQDGQLVRTSVVFEETLSFDESGNWQHVQSIKANDATNVRGTRVLDKQTLEVLSLELLFQNATEGQPSKVHYDLTETEYAANVIFKDGREQKGQARRKAIPMFDGQIAGIAIAALPLRQGYVATLPMIIPNLGVYWVEVTVMGQQTISVGEHSNIDVWEVNTHWLNLTDGDMYPAGREGSGGVYYIAVNPEEGMPHVIEYANDTGVISWDGVLY